MLYLQSASIVFLDKMYYNNYDNFAVQGDIILMELKENDIVNVINDIKNDILSTKHKIFENANNELLGLYFRIGKYIFENSKYGSKFIDNLSISLKIDFPDATGFSKRNLSRMKSFMKSIVIFQFCHRWWQNCHGRITVSLLIKFQI